MNNSRIRDILVQRGEQLFSRPFGPIPFTGDHRADAMLNDLAHYPHAFVLACLMDRRVKAERAWLVPFRFGERLGSFDLDDLARLRKDRTISFFVTPPPLHFMNEVMGDIFYSAVQRVESEYSGDASRIWADCPSSATIVRRFLEFQGAGPKIATMAANMLVRDFKIPVSDRVSIDISVDRHIRRTFQCLGLVRKEASDEELIYTARELNPMYPGVFDLSLWEIGRTWCHPTLPECNKCYMRECCPTADKK